MCMLDEIRVRRDEIYAIAKRHKAERHWVFGLCARREERPDSDVDLLVKFGEGVGWRDYDAIEKGVASLTNRSVDVVNANALDRSPCFAYNTRKDMVAL